MRTFISFITTSLLLIASLALGQTTTIRDGSAPGTADVIGSATSGTEQGLVIRCASGCIGASGTQDINVLQLLGVSPSVTNTFPMRLSTGVAYYDARDRNWTLASGTDSITVTGTVGISNSFLLDATLTGRIPSGSTPADNESNVITTTRLGVYSYIFDGSTWDRWTGQVTIGGTLPAFAATPTFNVGTFPDNEPFNLAQFGGNAVSSGAGDYGTGTQRVAEAWFPNLVTGQVPCGTTATSIASARAGRKSIGVTQIGTTAVYIGQSGSVTTANGDLLSGTAGAFVSYPYSGALFCIVGAGSQTVTFAEVY